MPLSRRRWSRPISSGRIRNSERPSLNRPSAPPPLAAERMDGPNRTKPQIPNSLCLGFNSECPPAGILPAGRRAAGQLPPRNGIEQLVRPPHERAALIYRLAPQSGSLCSYERPLAMLACNLLAQILHANPKLSPTGWTFLGEVRRTWHLRLTPFSCAPLHK